MYYYYVLQRALSCYLCYASLWLSLSHVVTTLWNTLCPHYTRLQYPLWRHITLLFSHKIVQESVRKILIHQDNFLLKCVCVWFNQFQVGTIEEKKICGWTPTFDGRHQERTEPFCATSCRLLFDLSYFMAAAKPPRGAPIWSAGSFGRLPQLNFPWLQGAATAQQLRQV